jgi:hypothetical protein
MVNLKRCTLLKPKEGSLAIKALNPQIMSRPTAMQNFIESERLANLVAKTIPALPAKILDGNFVQDERAAESSE